MRKSIFIHICKCGGTTIRSILNPLQILYTRDTNDIGSLWENKYKAFACCSKHHFTIVAASKEIDSYTFNKCFKFAFVRSPWARLVSSYHYGGYYRKETFNEYIRIVNEFAKKKTDKKIDLGPWNPAKGIAGLNCLDWISDDEGNVLVDFIGKLENFQEDFNVVCDKIGIPQKELPHKNKTKHKHYTEYYDDVTREIVAEKFAKDIKYFGYEFGE